MLEPHLRRAEDMAGGMKAQAHPEVVDRLAVGERLQPDVAEPCPQHAVAGRGGEVVGVAAARMVPVRVRDHRAVDRPPGVDVEVARGAVQPFPALDDEIVGRRLHQYRLRVAKSAKRIAPYAIQPRLRLKNGRRW